jgi:branched-chain amino acid transport system substrate-binding protein
MCKSGIHLSGKRRRRMSRSMRFSIIVAVCVWCVSLSYWSVRAVYATGSCSNIQGPGQCGLATGQPATGDPIKLGAIVTNVSGLDYSSIGKMAGAYFQCVNDNGGINNHPIEFILKEASTDPQQVASLAQELIEQDGVVGLVGSTAVNDCATNQQFYAEEGFYPIIAGVDPACFASPNFSSVNMGPLYSNLGGAQGAVAAGATGTLLAVSPDLLDDSNRDVVEFAQTRGLTGKSLLVSVPIADPAALAQQLVDTAGQGGGVVLDFTVPNVVSLLQAIAQQGLINSVIWASSTPPNDPSVAQQLKSIPAWNGKFLINAEFNLLNSDGSDQKHMNTVLAQYAPDLPSSSFTQMGYLAGRIATDALLSIPGKGKITQEKVNRAFRSVKNFASDLLCKPWYYDSTTGANVSNNTDRTVAPVNGSIVQVQGCFEIAALPDNNLAQIREEERELGLNTCSTGH